MQNLIIQAHEKNARIRVILKNGWTYTGHVLEIDTRFFVMRDKFHERVTIDFSSLSAIIPLDEALNPGGAGRR